MAKKDSVRGTLLVALVLCLVCSVLVSTAAVLLRPAQQANVELDRKRNVLVAGGLLEPGASAKEVDQAFKTVTTRYVDLRTGKFTDEAPAGGSGRAASRIEGAHQRLERSEDVAKIFRRENISEVYLVEANGKLERVILPVRGAGLWGTLFGFLALENDLNTVAGLAFYEHRETPGLGGEVDNPNWKALWLGREVFDSDGDVAISVVKGSVDPNNPQAIHQVDGLSGATLTSNGVESLLRFWLGSNGFGPFLKNLAAGAA